MRSELAEITSGGMRHIILEIMLLALGDEVVVVFNGIHVFSLFAIAIKVAKV